MAPIWRDYWTATLPDGREIPQFDESGQKFLWHNLPAKPTKIVLKPFDEALALKVRSASKVAAMPTANPPIDVDDLGDGLTAGMDERFHLIPSVKCLTCGALFPLIRNAKAECPVCHAHDDWFCADCQENKEPLVIDRKVLCPTCNAKGLTRGLKRIKKFQLFKGVRYDFQRWVRTGNIEVRVTRDRIRVRRYVIPEIEYPGSVRYGQRKDGTVGWILPDH